jgi:hypothetical protein
MRPLQLVALALMLAAGWARPASAWGPYTHVAIGREALETVEATPGSPMRFLLKEPCRTLFLAGSMGCDMTFSVNSFGKDDRAFDRLLHNPELCRRQVRAAAKTGNAGQMAFALGWYAHVLADRVMRQPGGVIYRNVFELDPATQKAVGGDVAELNKIAIDAILAREHPRILTTVPRFDLDLLAGSLRATGGSELPATDAALRERLANYIASFTSAIVSLREISRSLAANQKAFPELASALSETSEGGLERVPGIAESARVICSRLAPLVPAGLAADGSGLRPPPPPATLGFWDRVTSSLTRRSRSALQGDGLSSQALRGFLDGCLRAMNALGLARESTRRARLMATFLGEMVSGKRDWEGVKAVVRAAMRPRKSGETVDDPSDTLSPEDAPLDGTP